MFFDVYKRLFLTEVDRGSSPPAAMEIAHIIGQRDKLHDIQLREYADTSSGKDLRKSVPGDGIIATPDHNLSITSKADADPLANSPTADSLSDEIPAVRPEKDNKASNANQNASALASDTELPDLSKSDPEDVEPSLQPSNLPNAKLIAVRCLLRRLVAEKIPNWSRGMCIEIPDFLIIEAAEIWLPALEEGIPRFFQKRFEPSSTTSEVSDDADGDENARPRRRTGGFGASDRHRSLHLEIAVYCQPVGEKERRASRIVELVGDSLRQRQKVVVLTADDPALTFRTLRVAADAIWRLPIADDTWLREFAEEVTTKMANRDGPLDRSAVGSKFSSVAADPLASLAIDVDFDFEGLKPELLQVALRQGQSAQDYVDRLTKLNASGTEVAPKPASLIVTLDNLNGADEFVAWAKALSLDFAEYKEGKISWDEVDPGVLLSGPPGTGKTTAAQAAALFCQVAFVPTSYGEWQSKSEGYLGDVTSAMRDAFNEARKKAPSILFIDELDSVGSRQAKSQHKEWWRAIVNTLLGELDGVHKRDGVVVIGATNDPDAIDPAIRRAGRMDRLIEIPLPGREALKNIYRFYTSRELSDQDWAKDASSDAQFERLAALSNSFSGADVARVVRNAKRRARSQRRSLRFEDLFQELLGSDADTKLPESMQRRIAVHESAHALVRALQKPSAPPTVRLGGAGSSGGSTSFLNEDYTMFTAVEIDETLVLMLAGRAAEEIICGSASSGAGGGPGSDMARATMVAAMAETTWALGNLGLVWSNLDDVHQLDTLLALRPGAAIAVQQRLDVAYGSAKRMIMANRETVVLIAEALLASKILLPADILSLVQGAGICEQPNL